MSPDVSQGLLGALGGLPRWIGTAVRVLGTGLMLVIAVCFFLYPGAFVLTLLRDPGMVASGQPTALSRWFLGTAHDYQRWAVEYLDSRRAAQVPSDDVAATEWPLFGSVFFLVTAEQLIDSGQLPLDDELRGSLGQAAKVIAHPSSASWVKARWGKRYLERENVFYRMLYILGLVTYERITKDQRYHQDTQRQAQSLAQELSGRRYRLADDYPGECYPNDVLWAVVAIQRAQALEGNDTTQLSRDLMSVLDGPVKTEHGLPAFRVDANSAVALQPARGSGNSGILSFAGELDPSIAARWYESYVEHYWVEGGVSGFREMPRGMESFSDVDSGPVVLGMGSVASAFGIGAARAVGRYDHAVPLSLQAVAAAWPTPFGFFIPGVMGYAAADGWCFGELAMYFAMSRPNYSAKSIAYDGPVPPLVWILIALYLGGGTFFVGREIQYWRRRCRRGTGE